MNISERTYGVEFEFADVDKKKVLLPYGYSWSKDEVVINTDASNGSFAGSYGGEVNSPPLALCQKDRDTLKSVFENLIKCNGKITWTKAIHIHIFAGDFLLSELKNVFLLSYYTAKYIKKIGDVGVWNDQVWQCPAPTLEYVERVREAKTYNDFFNIFANSMTKGYIRHLINVPSFFFRKTIEFRFFNPTYNFSEVENSILFSYRFVQYALTHNEDNFKSIDSVEKFRKELKFFRELPKKTEPLLFAGDQTHPHECFVAKARAVPSKMIKILTEQCDKKLACVNPFLYDTELNLYNKIPITIYNTDEFNHIIYRIAKEKLKINFCKKFDFLQEFNDERAEIQIACLLIFYKIHKFSNNSEYAQKQLQSIENKIQQSIEKTLPLAVKLLDLFDKSEYVFGTIEEALKRHQEIFFQLDNNSKSRSVISSLTKYSDYSKIEKKPKTSYYELLEKVKPSQKFMVVSMNEYFTSMYKIAKYGKNIFYSTIPASTKINQKQQISKSSYIVTPPNDLEITDPSKLRIVQVKPVEFMPIQKTFIKKVHKIKRATFTFLVMYDKYCLGGFGFDSSKNTDYDLFLLSDFNTNNQVFRLSKFVLMCLQTKKVQKILQRKIKSEITKIYTIVYTNQPVSMKYRGVFEKVKDTKKNNLVYETNLGIIQDEIEAIELYNKMKAKNGK